MSADHDETAAAKETSAAGHADLDDLAAFALDALDDDEAAVVAAAIDRDARSQDELAEMGNVVAMLASTQIDEEIPMSLRSRVLAAAVIARAPGRPVADGDHEPIDEIESYRRSVHDLRAVLAAVADDEWRRTFAGRTIRDMVAHVRAVDRYMGAQLGVWPAEHDPSTDTDHLSLSEPFVRASQSQPFADVVAAWVDTTEHLLAHIDALDRGELDRPVRFHQFPMNLRTLLVVRTFELWTHRDDVLRAMARPRGAIDTARLALMTATAVSVLPLGMELAGRPGRGRQARIVLTGPGGGTWVRRLGAADEGPTSAGTAHDTDVVVVADAVEFCLRAANRMAADALTLSIEGDRSLADDILVGVGAFAMD